MIGVDATKAECVKLGLDPNLFFPDLDTGKFEDKALIKRTCSSCSEKNNCLDYVLNLRFAEEGFWGGTTLQQRRGLRSRLSTVDDSVFSSLALEVSAVT